MKISLQPNRGQSPKTSGRRWAARAGAVAAGVGAAALALAPAAQAAPITVFQIPASGLVVSGLVVPGPYFASVTATPTGKPGVVTFAAPARAETCATTAGRTYVNINYTNLTTGKRGSVTVKPCDMMLTPVPLRAEANTGRGQILVSSHITGSYYDRNAGQPSLPGVGTFTAP